MTNIQHISRFPSSSASGQQTSFAGPGAGPGARTGVLLLHGLGGSPAEIVTFLSAGFFSLVLCYGPVGSFLPTLFPPLLRYSGMSFAFNMAGILGGGLTPLFAQGLTMHYGLEAVGYYLAATAALSFLGVLLAGNKVWADLAAQGEATTA